MHPCTTLSLSYAAHSGPLPVHWCPGKAAAISGTDATANAANATNAQLWCIRCARILSVYYTSQGGGRERKRKQVVNSGRVWLEESLVRRAIAFSEHCFPRHITWHYLPTTTRSLRLLPLGFNVTALRHIAPTPATFASLMGPLRRSYSFSPSLPSLYTTNCALMNSPLHSSFAWSLLLGLRRQQWKWSQQ